VKRRLGIILAIAAALAGGSTAAQAASLSTTAKHWGCVGVQLIDTGVCVSNPLPERLPLPE
jgi:hypothetical protein